MRRYIHILSVFLTCLFFVGCVDESAFENTPRGNFEQLWKILDEGYCFFEYKGVDWDEVYNTYEKQIYARMTDDELFLVLSNMLSTLQDGHVNLMASKDRVSSWNGWVDIPDNFNEELIFHNYLGYDHWKVDGVRYTILNDNIGYIYYKSFTDDVDIKNMDTMFRILDRCQGIIIDVRNNRGGSIATARRLASRFAREKTLVGYAQHKSGKGRNDFSSPVPIYVSPSSAVNWNKKVVILTNCKTYSAANDFVNCMNYLPLTTTIGNRTGGGSGLPYTSELPNGWSVRFSASPHFNAKMEHLEFGIEPDIVADLIYEDHEKGIDTIIETARNFIHNSSLTEK